ncbi:hypothetical protein SCOR_03815 [Sulfidibacter corallicola]
METPERAFLVMRTRLREVWGTYIVVSQWVKPEKLWMFAELGRGFSCFFVYLVDKTRKAAKWKRPRGLSW